MPETKEEGGILDSVSAWFSDRWTDTKDLAETVTDTASDIGNAAGVAWDARTLLREEDGKRRATVKATEASRALQDFGGKVGLSEEGRGMLAGVDFADDEQALDILLDHNDDTVSISAEDLQIASVDQGAFQLGATRLTGMSAGGNFLADTGDIEIFARADTVDASDLRMQTPGGEVTATSLSLEGFRTDASYARDKAMLEAGSATKGQFSVDAARVKGVSLMGVGADSFDATGLKGAIDVDAGQAGLDADKVEAGKVTTGAMGGASVGSASLSALSMRSDFSNPEATVGEVRAEAAELAEILTPHGTVESMTGDGLTISHDAGTGVTSGGIDSARATKVGGDEGSISRVDLTKGSFSQDRTGITGEAERLGMIGVRSGEFTAAGIAVDEGRVRSEGDMTTASAGHVRADNARLGDKANVDLAMMSGFGMTSGPDGLNGEMVRGVLRGVEADGGSSGKASLGELDVWGGQFNKGEDGFTGGADRGTMSDVELQAAGIDASISEIATRGASLDARDGKSRVDLTGASIQDTRFRVDPNAAAAGSGSTSGFDLARAISSTSRLVDDVDARFSADLNPGRYGPAKVRDNTLAGANLKVRDGAIAHGTDVRFSRDIHTPYGTDISGASVDKRGRLKADVGVPLLGRLFNFEVGVNATDQVNEALGRGNGGLPSVQELGDWAAAQVTKGSDGSSDSASPLDIDSMRAAGDVTLRSGTLDAGVGQVELADGKAQGDNALSVQANGIDLVVAQFSRFLANSLTVNLGGAQASAGPGSVEDARLEIGTEGEGVIKGTVGAVNVDDVTVQS